MRQLNIEKGKTYENLLGEAVRIELSCSLFNFKAFLGSDGFYYASDGKRFDRTHDTVIIGSTDNLVKEAEVAPGMLLKGQEDTFETMRVWGEEIFGPVTAERIVERAGEEFTKELIPAAKHGFTPEATEEAADVVIILTRFPGLWEAIQRKMQINRARNWNKKGDGTGYHIPQTESK